MEYVLGGSLGLGKSCYALAPGDGRMLWCVDEYHCIPTKSPPPPARPPASCVLGAFLEIVWWFVQSHREQLGGNKFLVTDGIFMAKALGRTFVEYPVKDARCVSGTGQGGRLQD